MSMVNFDENQIIANGAKIYDQRAKIEAIADSIVDNGFDLLLFTSSGGSQAMLDPFAFYIRHMSRLPVENVLSANLMTGDCNRITDKTVAFLEVRRHRRDRKGSQLAERAGRAPVCRRRQGELHAGIHLR